VTGNNTFLSDDLLDKSEEYINNIVESMKVTDEFINSMGAVEAQKFGKTIDE
jgi:hypothetical protein